MNNWKKGVPPTGRPRRKAVTGPAPTFGRPRSTADTSNPPMPAQMLDARARKMVRDQQLNALRQMFTGTQLTLGPWDGTWESLKTGKGLATDIKGLVKTGMELGEGGGQAGILSQGKDATSFIKDMFGVKNIAELKGVIPGDIYKQFTKDVMPIVGTVMSGVTAIQKTADTVIKTYGVTQMQTWGLSARGGDPAAAVRALHTKLKVSAASTGTDAALAATKFGTSAASLVGDGGTTANLTLGIIGLVKKLLEMALDFREMQAGNKLLKSPNALDLSVFKASPILGCYMIVNANTSDIVNLAVEDIGKPGWQDRVETMVKRDLRPMIKYGNTIINESNLKLKGIKGRVEPMQSKVDSRNFVQKASFAIAPKNHMKMQRQWASAKKAVPNPFKKRK